MMTKEDTIAMAVRDFTEEFKNSINKNNIEVPELPDEIIEKIINEFFNKKSFGEARNYFYDVLYDYIEDHKAKPHWSLESDELKKTPEYKAWKRYSDIRFIWGDSENVVGLESTWVSLNGKKHTYEEAAKIAADKWCELLFGWHLQDNGALNETHGGGFPACALATVLADKSKEGITEEMKKKAHKLFYEYYLRMMHYEQTRDMRDLEWLKETLKDKDDDYTWKYGFDTSMYCDYDPCWAIYLILVNSGVEDHDACNICPWKTGISIRREDNAVLYHTYQKCEEL